MSTNHNDQSLLRWASYASVGVAIILVSAKAATWLATDSLSLLTSLVDAVVDVTASFVTLFGVRIAARPADEMHRYGYGKAEALAALTQALLLIGATFILICEGLMRIIRPHPMTRLDTGIAVTVFCTLLTVFLVVFESYVGKKTQSQAIAADRVHHFSDIVANATVLLALFLTHLTGWPRFDPIFAVTIAVFYAWSASKIARDAIQTLLDRELPLEDRRRIEAIILAHPEARGMHDLRTRSGGGRHTFIEFHLELDEHLPVREAHAISDKIERAVAAAFQQAEVIAHIEPAGIDDERLDHRVRASSS